MGRLINTSTGTILLSKVHWCDSFLCKLRGLMFRSHLEDGEGLLMVEPRASRSGASIHMLFMSFPIATIWLDGSMCVVDSVLAKPWRPAYIPAKAAKFTLEASSDLLSKVSVGETLVFEPIA